MTAKVGPIALCMLAVLQQHAFAQTANSNVKTMIDAARHLESQAFLLVKRSTVRSPVAVIFGYVDNEAACHEIAATLTASGAAGTFECDAIHPQ
jgi:hypothetical protein